MADRDLFLAVHGETHKNRDRAHGRVSAAGERLTPVGTDQARWAGAVVLDRVIEFADMLRDRSRRVIDIVSSSYLRCEETAQRITRAIGEYAVKMARDVQTRFHVQQNLRGIDLGPYNGLTYEQIAAADPVLGAQMVAWQRGTSRKPPIFPGESNEAFRERLSYGIDDVLHRYDGNATVIVGSSSAMFGMSSLLAERNRITETPVAEQDLPYFPTPPGSIQHWRDMGSGLLVNMSGGFQDPQSLLLSNPVTDRPFDLPLSRPDLHYV